jgi:oxygen-independent coproporphyrinogen-3 oxidase
MQQLVESLYIHYPYCRHLCNYCDFYKLKQSASNYEQQLSQFQNHLLSSLEILAKKVHEPMSFSFGELKTIYFGGGTPSLLRPSGLAWVLEQLSQKEIRFSNLQNEFEFTLEVDPGAIKSSEFLEYVDLGVNRFSFGLQTLNEDLLKVSDRKATMDEMVECLGQMKDLGVNYSVDFLLGIPKSQKRNIAFELEKILSYSPKHISLYILNPKTNYVLKRFMPEDEQVAAEFLLVHDLLTAKGFRHYEVSNYALPGFEGRHNYGYWKRKSSAALGASAAGLLRKSSGSYRYQWAANMSELPPRFTSETLTPVQEWLESVYLSTRLIDGFSLNSLLVPNLSDAQKEKKWQSNLELFETWEHQGKVEHWTQVDGETWYRFTSHGQVILDSLVKKLL